MAILAECPQCHKKQSIRNKACACGNDLDKTKRSQKVRYWIDYIVPGTGKAKREPVAGANDPRAYSIEEARAAEGKRKAQRVETPRILQEAPQERMTFEKLSDWYLKLEKIKGTKYYKTLQINFKNFNADFGEMLISQLKPIDLENYQAKRKKAGKSDSYTDQDIGAARAMVNKAFENDMIGGEVVKVFRRVKRLLKANANARERILSLDEFSRLAEKLPTVTRAIFITGFYTGMRRGEIFSLTWDKVDLRAKFIRLEAADTKDKEPRLIPISPVLVPVLKALPRALHDQRVFPYSTLEGLEQKFRRDMQRACKLARIPYGRKVRGGFTPHDLRHTFNTYMRKAGVAQSVIMKITGHSTDQMFRRYNTIDSEDAREAMSRLNGFLNLDQTLDQTPADSITEPK
ncbi:MAG: tyrosine-type recombinase/integrase [Syntrophobacteraceae bacterium]